MKGASSMEKRPELGGEAPTPEFDVKSVIT
jgi:hypothetical protein